MDKIPPGTDLNTVPIAPNPSDPLNYKPNLTGKAELEDITVAICAVVIALQVIFLSIRVYTKLSAKIRLGYDDWCAVSAFVLSLGVSICLIWNKKTGRHSWDYSLALALDPTVAKLTFSYLMLLGPAVFMGKLALLALYLKIFGHIPKVRWSIYAVLVFSMTVLVMTPLDAVKCGRIKGQPWGMQNPACSETFLYGVVQGVASLLVDLFILVLPIPIIMGLNLPRQKRVGVLIIFLTGGIAVVCDIIVMKFRVDLYSARDPVYAGFLIVLCSIVETGISVVCSSMPTLAKFGRQHLFEWKYFVSIRSYFTTGRSSSSEPSAKSSGYPRAKPRKRPDPYSVNMPTEDSVTRLNSNAYIELDDHGSLAPASVQEVKKPHAVHSEAPYYDKSADRLV